MEKAEGMEKKRTEIPPPRNPNGSRSETLSHSEKIKLMELACGLPNKLNGDDWKVHYKEMVELITGTASLPGDNDSELIEELPPGSITYGDDPAQK